jgi:hypothetical protein
VPPPASGGDESSAEEPRVDERSADEPEAPAVPSDEDPADQTRTGEVATVPADAGRET